MRMKRAALSAASQSRMPPLCSGWLATMPAARPPKRVKPTTMFRAQVGLISNQDSRSLIALITLRTSYAARGLAGTICSRPSTRRSGGSSHSASGGGSALLDGR